ncbi:protein FAM135A-like isoform X2 [Dermacentor silvarum]|uniref:protein FAM135A-like isoform X2 n=1 Tax=Dermacentor silvarum TaxID=543639 RepID=UPI0021015099|nr:protein FAM135A-like isoform X2 [Dermacentor silvarum]
MAELQVTLEFFIELFKFSNVDLFQRGYYQIRTALKVPQRLPARVEVQLPKSTVIQSYALPIVFPPCIVNGTAVSKTFQILYKNEEVYLHDTVLFKVHALVDAHKVRDMLSKADFQLSVELWFTDQNFGPDHHKTIQCVSSRLLTLHMDPSRGLHHHIPVLFDYFHLSAVSVTIHASLLAVYQPYISVTRTGRAQWFTGSPRLASRKSMSSSLESVFFGPQTSGSGGRLLARLQRACMVHWELCSLLLTAYGSLQRRMVEFMRLLPPWQHLRRVVEDSLHLSSCLEGLSNVAKQAENEEDFVAVAHSDVAQLCGALIVLWKQFLEVVADQDRVRQQLARQHHLQRVKRFAEAYFVIERPRIAVLSANDASTQLFFEVTEALRRSEYLALLPPLEVECAELDGDSNNLPIIYEEHYQDFKTTTPQGCASQSCLNLSDISLQFDDRRPSASAVSSMKLSEKAAVASKLLGQKSVPLRHGSPTLSADADLGSPTSTSSTSSADAQDRDGATRSSKGSASSSRAKVKLKARTASLLRQLKRPHLNNSSVTLLAFKRLDALRTRAAESSESTVSSQMKHSQSSVAVTSANLSLPRSVATSSQSHLLNSESMPDLTTQLAPTRAAPQVVPPAPPPPRSRVASDSLNANFDALFVSDPVVARKAVSESCSCVRPHLRTALAHSLTAAKHRRSTSSCQVGFDARRTSAPLSNAQDPRRESLGIPDFRRESLGVPDSRRESLCMPDSRRESLGIPDSRRDSLDEVFLCPGTGGSSKSTSGYESADTSSDVVTIAPMPEKSATSPLDGGTSIPPLPPPQFRDSPKDAMPAGSFGAHPCSLSSCKEKLTNHSVSAQCSSFPYSQENSVNGVTPSTEKQAEPVNAPMMPCEGTAFFPKPPAEFASDQAPCLAPTLPENGDDEEPPEDPSMIQNGVEKEVCPSDEEARRRYEECRSYLETKCTLMEMLTDPKDEYHAALDSVVEASQEFWQQIEAEKDENANDEAEDIVSVRRASAVNADIISFVKAKEEFRAHLNMPWLWYSDFPVLASSVPYFQCDNDLRAFSPEGLHLVICVHGLDGNSADLRLVRTYLELGLPMVNFEFLMSERNQGETFEDFETMTDRLVSEISYHIEVFALKPTKISFIGHSLGNIIIRSALTRPEMKPYLNLLCTFLSLSGPHLGTLFNNSGLVNMGMWFMQKWKKSGSLLQLAMKDTADIRQSFLYKLSQKPGLEFFKHVLLFGSMQDRYVPIHSARIELCKAAVKDATPIGAAYREMVSHLLRPLASKPDISLVRYDVHHALPSSANSLIGRAAHIAVLDSELFIEKFMVVTGLKYFA